MALLYGSYTAPRGTSPSGQVDGSLQGGHVRVHREKINLTGQTTADTIALAFPSAGESFLFGVITSDVSLGASQISIGTAAAPAKYRAAAPHTAIDTPISFAKSQAQGTKLTTDEMVILTIATANLPAAGTLHVDLYFAQT